MLLPIVWLKAQIALIVILLSPRANRRVAGVIRLVFPEIPGKLALHPLLLPVPAPLALAYLAE